MSILVLCRRFLKRCEADRLTSRQCEITCTIHGNLLVGVWCLSGANIRTQERKYESTLERKRRKNDEKGGLRWVSSKERRGGVGRPLGTHCLGERAKDTVNADKARNFGLKIRTNESGHRKVKQN